MSGALACPRGKGTSAGVWDSYALGRIHDGSDADFAVSVTGGSVTSGRVAVVRRTFLERPELTAASDSAIEAISVTSRYALAFSASAISECNDASALSRTSAALSINDIRRSL